MFAQGGMSNRDDRQEQTREKLVVSRFVADNPERIGHDMGRESLVGLWSRDRGQQPNRRQLRLGPLERDAGRESGERKDRRSFIPCLVR